MNAMLICVDIKCNKGHERETQNIQKSKVLLCNCCLHAGNREMINVCYP